MIETGAGFGSTSSNRYLKDIGVLVAEDNELARQIIREVLRALGANRIYYALDGRVALEHCRDYPVDLALIDWEMPLLSGLEFVRAIRHSHDSPNNFLPIIMTTAHSGYEQVLRARDSGINEYVIKPFSVRQILSRIRSVIEQPRDFVKTKKYFGPDRRRKQDPRYRGPDRRRAAADEP